MAKTKQDYSTEGRNLFGQLVVRGDSKGDMPLFGTGKSWQAKAFAEGWNAAKQDKEHQDLTARILAETDVIEHDIDSFINGYLVAALWSSTDTPPGDREGEPVELDNYEWAPGQEVKLMGECLGFILANAPDLLAYEEQKTHAPGYGAWECAGHDFWLTRCGHGVGFWDRGLGELGQRLTDASKTFGNVDLYLGDDELVYAAGYGS